jgi:transposase InsO family protein
LAVTTRTVRSWKKKASHQKRGRKKAGVSDTHKLEIELEWEKQGCPGSRPIIKSLPNIRVRAIREVIANLKREKKKRFNKHREENRTTVQVHTPRAVMVMDGATIKAEGGDFIVRRDRGSISTHAHKCEGENLNSQDTLRVLTELKTEEKLPLVMGTDNGSPFCAIEVESFMAENKVIHLKSLPRVPQQNGSAENSVGDLKKLTAMGFTSAQACINLNQHRLRAKNNWQTPEQVEQNNLKLYTVEFREEFYQAARSAITNAQLGIESEYEKRKAEREAIFATLESFSLITRTRGHPSRWVKAEEIT